ncbi:MAG: 3-dehydroquinate synthase [Balneolaceae bacterium]|nr:3-dehydroquinate synthase [Balneolaceae bacterium]
MSHTFELGAERRWSSRYSVGERLWDSFRTFGRDRYGDARLMVVVDEKVMRLHGETLEAECGESFRECVFLQVPEGESSKSVSQWKRLTDALMENSPERGTPLLAVGGGVTGDLAGFAAATLLRGVPLLHMPTTLLAMVDSSIGGKTGVNHPAGKNLVGAFHQPDAVFAQTFFLETLERREWINGLAEVLKYAAIREPQLFGEIEEAAGQGFVPSPRWEDLIHRSARIKAEIVEEDALEKGRRAWLNFGHTFGHALEKIAGYGNISHGEAVFLGMIAACRASELRGAPVDAGRLEPFIPLYRAPYGRYADRVPELIEAMKRDKKVKDHTIRLVLLDRWGEPRLVPCEDEELIGEAWRYAFRNINSTPA